jgi:hypothetical protein
VLAVSEGRLQAGRSDTGYRLDIVQLEGRSRFGLDWTLADGEALDIVPATVELAQHHELVFATGCHIGEDSSNREL